MATHRSLESAAIGAEGRCRGLAPAPCAASLLPHVIAGGARIARAEANGLLEQLFLAEAESPTQPVELRDNLLVESRRQYLVHSASLRGIVRLRKRDPSWLLRSDGPLLL